MILTKKNHFFQKKLIDNRPCLNPARATEEELKQELFDKGHATTGTREQMITRLTKPDNSKWYLPLETLNLDNIPQTNVNVVYL